MSAVSAADHLGREASPELSFLGGTGTVTGSRFLVETPRRRVLVDCGLYQGRKELRLRNWAGPGVDPASIDAVILTHAHIDHCGYLPALVRDGFTGPVHCTPDTAALLGIMLPDSGRLAEEEAAFAARKGYSSHAPPRPLFTERDAWRALESVVPVPFGEEQLSDGWSFRLGRAGHILGSAWVRLRTEGSPPRAVLFTGDLGRGTHPLLSPPDPRPDVDVVVCESTYGDKRHAGGDPAAELASVIRRTVERGGSVVVPSFAVDRTDVVLFHLKNLVSSGAIPRIPIFLDSPMATRALEVYRGAAESGSPDIRPELVGTQPFDVEGLEVVTDVERSKRLNRERRPVIIISASGMITGGRVLHHVAHRIADARHCIALIGHQADGTRGRRLLDGERNLKMLGRYWPVRAEIAPISSMSTHADGGEIVEWILASDGSPDTVFVVHGEHAASAALAESIAERTGWTAVAPRLDEKVRLDAG